uniref:CSON006412 protein n=1 Tax=Culicoides sonorensis TaxID=179676 RepID=A0A336LW14_CULSO
MDGNAQNMYHGQGGHQGDPYYRYDPATPRGMGPPPGTPYGAAPNVRHRAPHPMQQQQQQQQQQPQYPGYQPTDSMYGMDPNASLSALGDLGPSWGAQAAPQASPYVNTMGYGHPQPPQQTQRQPGQGQAGYRQHMAGYPQQDPKLAYSQQGMMGAMMPQQTYQTLGQTQTQPTQAQQQQQQQAQQQQQRVPQHYGHMYPTGPQSQPGTNQQYGYSPMGQVSGRSSHVSYGHVQLDQSAYNQHLTGQPPPGHHLNPGQPQQQQQQPPSQIPPHPGQQSHLAQASSHHSIPSQTVPTNPQMYGTQQSHMTGMQQGGPNQQPTGSILGQVPTQHNQNPSSHQMTTLGHQMSWPGPTAPGPTAPQQQSYVPNAKPQTTAVTQHGNSPQYRTAYPQLSPQMSPRQAAQMSPHPQMSPRPLMSPAKPPSQSSQPPSVQNQPSISSPRPPAMTKAQQQQQQQQQQQNQSSSAPVNTLQALEQLVGPSNQNTGMPTGMEYSQQPPTYRPGVPSHVQLPGNPMSPMGPRMPMSPQHQPWRQTSQSSQPQNGSSHLGMPPHSVQLQQMQQQNPNVLPPVSEMMAAQSQALPPISTVGSQIQSANYNMEPLKQMGMSMSQSMGQGITPSASGMGMNVQMNSQPQQQQQQQQIMPPITNNVIPPATISSSSSIISHQPQPPLQQQQQQQTQHTLMSSSQISNNSKSTDNTISNNDNDSHKMSVTLDSHQLQQIDQQQQQQESCLPVNSDPSDNSSLLDTFMTSNSSTCDEQLNNQPQISSNNTSTPITSESVENNENDSAKDVSQTDLESISNSQITDGNVSTGNHSVSENQLQLTSDNVNSDTSQTSLSDAAATQAPSSEPKTTDSSLDNDNRLDLDQTELPQLQNQETTNSSLNIPVECKKSDNKTDEITNTPISTNENPIADVLDSSKTAADTTHPITPVQPVIPSVVAPAVVQTSTTNPLFSQMHYQQTPISHDKERAALQQQIQEMYCMTQSQEVLDKTKLLQERLNLLQQHETNDQCNGGPQCILQTPLFTNTMIDSPQVSSTTGRGRARNSSKPRKPRSKKADKSVVQDDINTTNTDQNESLTTQTVLSSTLPVSEDSVTAGTGLPDDTIERDTSMDISQEGVTDLDTSTDPSGKKIKKPRKPKIPKEDRPLKDRRRSDGNKRPRKNKKLQSSDNSFDNTMVSQENQESNTQLSKSSHDENQSLASLMHNQNSSDANSAPSKLTIGENEIAPSDVTDFDDIPVSKISKDMLNETDDLDTSKRSVDGSEHLESTDVENSGTTTPRRKDSRRKPYRKCPEGSDRRRRAFRGRGKGRAPAKPRRGRLQITVDSDQEDDLIGTPPQSPEQAEGEIDSSKRRSARNTARKKYTDDILLRFSDDESGVVSPSPSRKPKKESTGEGTSTENPEGSEAGVETSVTTTEHQIAPDDHSMEIDKHEEAIGKPNYVYINTSDEDNMVVQYVLAQRIGKRELKVDPPKPPTPAVVKQEDKSETEPSENKSNEDTKDNEKEISEVKAPETEKMETDEIKEEKESNDDVEKDSSDIKDGEKDEMEITEEKSEKIEEKQEEETKEKSTEEPIDKSEESPSDEKASEEKSENKDDSEEVKEKVEAMDVDENQTTSEKTDTKQETNEENKTKDDSETVETPTESTPANDESESKPTNESDEKDNEDKPEPVFIEVEEFLVKYRNFSYLHCEWRTEEELLKGDKRVSNKIRRFQQKQAHQLNIFDSIEEDHFNPDFIEVDRVLDVSEHTDEDGNTVKHYLVKWKSLPYEDSTWELEEDVDEIKIEQFYRFNKIPPRSEWRPKKRPHPDQWKQLDKTPIYKGGNSLRPYQLEGLNWLKFSWYKGNNCILADEMGLGKTIQSLTFIHSVWEYGIRGPFLVIAPLSTIPNWQREFEGWTDMNIIVYHGSAMSRQMLNDYELYYKTDAGKVIKEITKFNVLITTFEMIVTDHMDLRNFNWRVCVIDEAHRLKNRNCKLLEGLRQLNLEHRVLLSGTPLQNNVSELFSLLNFLEPSQFASSEDFMRDFGSLRTEDEVTKLQALLKPMMLRRLKDDVEKSLAPKEETIVEVELTNIQKKYYRGIMEQNFSFLQKGTTAANIPNLMNTMMELRKCCIHPYLLNGAEEQIQFDYRAQNGEDQEAYYKNLIVSSGKMVLIDKLLPKLKDGGHRVLIFSQMVRCLDILEDYLIYRKYPYERIDGRIRGNLRQAAIDRYSKPDSDRFVFLLCTKAGGLGINLTAADTVIIYDSDWNPQNDLQAQARCHRIGQQKMVKIYRLLCRNTYEREMFDKASLKLGLDKAILQSMNTQGKDGTNNKQLSKKEIEDLLKKGAYGAVMDDDNAGDKFCEEDIDSILQRRTQVITMESEKGSTFSKASFASQSNRSDIDVDDPDFWAKWAKKAEIDPNACEKDETEDLILAEPRRRTQIKRYGQEDAIELSEDSSAPADSDEEGLGLGLRSSRRRAREKKKMMKQLGDDYIPRDRDTLAALGFDEVQYGSWARSECFKVEKGLLSYGWGRWSEVAENGQFKRGWRETDIEDCARIILLYCLIKYQGDEKIKSFIWELIAPIQEGEEKNISRSHSGLHNLVPRGRNAKAGRKGKGGVDDSPKPDKRSSSEAKDDFGFDENHWSKDEKYDAEAFLEPPYKKHLTRHANKVLLRVRMLYYIKHEVIGDCVQQIHDGVHHSEIPIRPPPTNDQVPVEWWNPICCDRSLLIGTYKHGCENYRAIRADPKLCFASHCGPGEGVEEPIQNKENEEDTNSKQGDEENEDENPSEAARSSSVTSKENNEQECPSSSGVEEEASVENNAQNTVLQDDSALWPSMQDLNTRLRRVITAYQRNYKKEELKQQQKAKLQPIVTPAQLGLTPSSSTAASASSSNASTPGATMMNAPQSTSQLQQQIQQGQQNSQQQQQTSSQNNQGGMPSAADLSLMLSLGLGLNPADASQLANLDLQKLAHYLKMERREKIEQVVRERERGRFEQIHKKWTRREENEFLRVLTGYGIDLVPNSQVPTPDWTRFKAFAKLDKKSDETLSDYYKVFIAMCKRQAGVKLQDEERNLEGYIDEISEDHAKLVLDRLDLLSKLREISRHSKLDERIKLCENNLDTPDWWVPGKHDRELIRAVLKHGLYRSDQFILNDTEFSFFEAEKRYLKELEAHIQNMIKAEQVEKEAELKKEMHEEAERVKKHDEEEKQKQSALEEKEAEEVTKENKSIEDTPTVEAADTKKIEEEKEIEETSAQSPKETITEQKIELESEVEANKKQETEEMQIDENETLTKEKTSEETTDSEQKIDQKESEPMETDDLNEKLTSEEKEKEPVKEADSEKEILEENKTSEVKTDEKTVELDQENKEKIEKDQEEPEKEAKITTDTDTKSEETLLKETKDDEKPEILEDDEKSSVEEKVAVVKEEAKESEVTISIPVKEEKLKTEEIAIVKQSTELKQRYPDLEVFQPLLKLKQLDSRLGDSKTSLKSFTNLLDTTMVVKWFRDFALEKRIGHIVYCIDNNEWPVGKSYSAYTGCLGIDLDAPLYETIKRIIPHDDNRRSAASTPDIITITTDKNITQQLTEAAALRSSALSTQALNQSMAAVAAANSTGSGRGKGKKRHIAIDVETERAKLHALLNSTAGPGQSSDFKTPKRNMTKQQQSQAELLGLSQKALWEQAEQELNAMDMRNTRSTRNSQQSSGSQPPPAHQHQSARSNVQSYTKSTVIPGTSSTLTPIDLSSSLPKMNIADMLKNPLDLSEAQDFSKPKNLSANYSSGSQGKSKLNDMLSKLMKKNNVPVEEPPVTVEKKRRKLDEIVLGLATSKNEQKSIFDAPSISNLTSGKKTQITPSVSVTPASAPTSQSQSSQNQQKPFTITVTSVPGNSNKNQSSSSGSASSSSRTNPGLDVLQSMAGLSGMSSKDSLNALFLQAAQQEQQAFLKQQQKMIQQMPANSTQRKQYEAMFADMKQMAELSAKLGYSPHDSKVNKWLQEQTQQLANQALELDYLSGRSSSTRQRSSSSQQQGNSSSSAQERGSSSMQQQSSSSRQNSRHSSNVDSMGSSGFNWKNLTGEENVAVINKINGKRLTGSKAPQLKRLTQWLSDNPAYEIDPKWAESIALPPPSPIAKPSPTETSSTSSGSSKQQQQQQRPSSSSSAGGQSSRHEMSSPYGQAGQSSSSSSSSNKKSSNSSSNNNNSSSLNYPGLAGLNASLLSSIPGLGAFDPKNNPLMMPFGGVGSMSGMAGLQNMNNMNLFANLAGLSGLAGMDPQSLAAMMQAAGFDPASAAALVGASTPPGKSSSSSSQGQSSSSNSKSRKSESNQQSSSSSSSKVPTSSASQLNANFPFFFPNPSLLYTPLGLGGLNPYSLPGGMAAYDQLAQQCNLLNGGGLSGSPTGKSSSSKQQSSSTQGGSSSRNSGAQSASSSPVSSKTRSSMSSSVAREQAAREAAQLQQLLLPHDTHLLEQLSRTSGLDITQSSRGGSSNNNSSSSRENSEKRSSAAQQANKDAIEKLERERRKLIDSLTRSGFPPEIAMQAFAATQPSSSMGKSSSSSMSGSGSSKSKDMQLPMPTEFALLQEMANQAAAAAAHLTQQTQSSSNSGSSSSAAAKRQRDQEIKEAFEQLSKNPVELLARSLGVGPGISLIPTSSNTSSNALSQGQPESKRMRQDSHSSTSSRASMDSKSLSMLVEEMKSPRTRSSDTTHANIDKITLTPVSASQIVPSLPSQTTISLAPPSSGSSESNRESRRHHHRSMASDDTGASLNLSSRSDSRSESKRDSERETRSTRHHHDPSSSMDLSSRHLDPHEQSSGRTSERHSDRHSERSTRDKQERSSLTIEDLSARAQQSSTRNEEPIDVDKHVSSKQKSSSSSSSDMKQSNHEMDIEDLIAPVKVSKESGNVMPDEQQLQLLQQQQLEEAQRQAQQEVSEEESSIKSKDSSHHKQDNAEHQGKSSDEQHGTEESQSGRGRRSTRNKRQRTEDYSELVIPERKRELRSSASRQAAAAAARMAAEAKAARLAAQQQAEQEQESLNLSKSSKHDDSGKSTGNDST